MKYCQLLTVCLLVFNLIAPAQSVQQLQLQLEAARSNEDKIYALNALAEHYTYTLGKDSIANSYGDRQIELANQTGDNELLAVAYYLEGKRLIQTVPSEKRYKRAKECLYQTIKIAAQIKKPFYGASAYVALFRPYYNSQLIDGDKELELGNNCLKLATVIPNDSLIALALVSIAVAHRHKNDNIEAYRKFQEALQIAERLDDPYLLSYSLRALGEFYWPLGELNKGLTFYLKAEQSLEGKSDLTQNDLYWLYWIRQGIAQLYGDLKNAQKANDYIRKYSNQASKFNMQEFFRLQPLIQQDFLLASLKNYDEERKLYWNPALERLYLAIDFKFGYYINRAFVFQKTGQLDSAAYYYKIGFANVDNLGASVFPNVYNDYASFLWQQGNLREAIMYYGLAENKGKEANNLDALINIYHNLDSLYFKTGNVAKAYRYNKLYHEYKDSVKLLSKEKELALLEVQDEQRKEEQQRMVGQEKAAYQNRIKTYAFIGVLTGLLLIAGILYISNQHKQKANALLQQQKNKTEQALEDLKATQDQLVQREKMASLGELTAGIAHEIQNPLNFVNNFSDVNTELLTEMKDEADKGNLDEVKALANNVIENQEKINHHGRRADAIVKGMLQHSRTSSSKIEPTDINKLADDYLRMSYHGYQVKNKQFNALIKTDFDESIGKLNIMPQDIGRVLLNLYNNAFYAVNERKKTADESYHPTIIVHTKKINDRIEIHVSDNGNGIPQKIVDKIFQPFFTTKPTGQGTGLGLSLSYDIIKAHGGEINVKTKEGEYAKLVVQLPDTQNHY